MESPATTQNSIVSIQILQDKYSTTLLEGLTSWDVVSVTFNFLATRLRATLRGLLDGAGKLASRLVGGSSMRGMWGSPGPGPQLKPLLERFPILLVGRIFNGDGVVTFADFTTFFCLALALLWNIYKSRRGSWVRDKLRNVILQQTTWLNATTSI
jgi:hypothetical protein